MRLPVSFVPTCLLALGACRGGAAAPPPDQPRPAPAIVMRAVDDGAFLLADNANIFADTARRVIRDSVEWKSLWRQAVGRQLSPPPRPVVDFGAQVVIFAAAGRMKLGDAIHIDSVGARDNLTVIVIRTTKACHGMPSDAFPFEMAVLPRIVGRVQFREHVLQAPTCP